MRSALKRIFGFSWRVAISFGPAIALGLLLERYLEVGEGRILGAVLLTFFVIATALVTVSHFNKLCRLPRDELSVAIRREKFRAELASGSTVLGAAMSLWFLYASFDMQNTDAKLDHWSNARRSLDAVLTTEYCKQPPYRAIRCDLIKGREEQLLRILWNSGSDNKAISTKLAPLDALLVQMAKEPDRQVAAVAMEAKAELDKIAGLDEGARTVIAMAVFTLLMAAAGAAVSRKVALAAFDLMDRPDEPATPITLTGMVQQTRR